MIKKYSPVPVSKGNYLNGQFRLPADPSGEIANKSPADLTDELGGFPFSYRDIDEAVTTAKVASQKWKKTTFEERVRFLKRYQECLKSKEEELVDCLARETGKPLWEAKGELVTMVNRVDFAISEGMKYVEPFEMPNVMADTNGSCHYRPHGVVAVIAPFNMPGYLPSGHIIPALLTGNCVILKPSEKTPLVGQLIADAFASAGLPPGVFSLLQGDKEVGRRLVTHEGVDAVLFTGSYEVGNRIKQDTLLQHWKLVVLEMGAKNPAIIWEDADLEVALQETLVGAFVTAGQRCTSTSRIILHQKHVETFISRFHERAKAFEIGHPYEDPFIGPLIDSSSVDRYMKFLGIAAREGCEVVMRGKALDLKKKGHYVAPSICLVTRTSIEATRKSVYQQSELFAPNVAIIPVTDLDEAIAQANATQYGLVASVYSKDRSIYEKCWENLHTGLINWNRSTTTSSSRLPFGGVKKSGNHFPTGVTATKYCTFPVTSLEASQAKSVDTPYPGLNWE